MPKKPAVILYQTCAVCGKEYPGFGHNGDVYCWDHLPESAAEWKAERIAMRDKTLAAAAATIEETK